MPKVVVPYGQPCLLRPPLTASFLGHSHGFSELVRTLREKDGFFCSSVYIVPKDQIFDAPLSLRGPASSYRPSADGEGSQVA